MTPELYVEAVHHGGQTNLPIVRLVVHATCPGIGYPKASAAGQARATARYFVDPASGGSAHHVADIIEIVRCVLDGTVAWHAPPNSHSLGYEICGESTYTREQWLSPQVWPAVARVAQQVRADAAKYRVPIRRLTVADVAAGASGVCGHVDVSLAFRQSDHTDPGPDFPWPEFMALLVDQPTPTPAPEDDVQVQTLARGATGRPVRALQVILNGYLKDARIPRASLVCDGKFGANTQGALQDLQKHWDANGVPDVLTPEHFGKCTPYVWWLLIGQQGPNPKGH